MNNNSGKRLRNTGYILLGIAMLSAYGAVSTMGFSDIQNDLTQCREMEALWISSGDGSVGWPPGTCDNL
jgi:hypothetical protein